MHKKTLRELAKFAAGLITGDLLGILLISSKGLLPITILGIQFDSQTVVWALLFDLIVLIFLVHYAWQFEDRPRSGGEKTFHRIAGIVFAIVALLHLSRLIFGWQFSIGGWEAPYWLNGLGAVVTGFLAYLSFHLTKK